MTHLDPAHVPGDADRAALRAASPLADGLLLTWLGGGGVVDPARTDHRPEDLDRWRVAPRVVVAETPNAVHVLVVSGPAPGREHVRDGWVAGVGTTETAVAHLSAPLGGRAVWDDSGLPAHRVDDPG